MKSARGKKSSKLDQRQLEEDSAQLAAIHQRQPVTQYDMDGTILDVNEKFEALTGFSRAEMIGQHASMFVDEKTRHTNEYKSEATKLWELLRRGEDYAGEGKRTSKHGKEIWVEYSYTPVIGVDGKPYKVVNVLRDITQRTLANTDYRGQIAAIGKAQAVIEFNMDGTIITANDNFLKALGYTLDEVKGKHHSLFVDEAYKQSAAYKEFWAKLNRAEYDAAEYKRIGKGGREVWIQASYNPILDLDRKPFKVVKYATDVTPTETDQCRLSRANCRHRKSAGGDRVQHGRHGYRRQR